MGAVSLGLQSLHRPYGQVAEQLMAFGRLRIMHILLEGLHEHPHVQAGRDGAMCPVT